MVTTLYLESPQFQSGFWLPRAPGANTEKLRVTVVDEGVRNKLLFNFGT